MLLRDFVDGVAPPLSALQPVPDSVGGQEVHRVVLADESTARSQGSLHDALIVAEPEDAAAVTALVRRRVLAVACPGDDVESFPPAVRNTCRRLGLPLLTAPAAFAAQLWARLEQHRLSVVSAALDQRAEMAALAYRLADQAEGPEALVRWLKQTTGAAEMRLTPDEAAWTASAEPGHGVLVHRIYPGQVLSAVRTGGWALELRTLVADAVPHLCHLHNQQQRQDHERQQRVRDLELRHSLVQLAMLGDLGPAQRVAPPSLRRVLDAPTVQVAVMELAPHEGSVLAAAEVEEGFGPAIAAPNPEHERQLLLLLPRGTPEDVPASPQDPASTVEQLVAAVPGRSAGFSGPEPWSRVEYARQAAQYGLRAAQHTPERISTYRMSSLASLLGREGTRWAHYLLKPLEELTPARRDRLISTARRTLELGDWAASRQSHTPRTTVSSRTTELMNRLGLSRSRLVDKALVLLAVRLAAQEPAPAGITVCPPHLYTALRGSWATRQWARDLLGDLDDDARKLLVTWLETDGSITRTAELRGVGRNVVARELEEAGRTLARTLTEPGDGPHDVLWALIVLGELPGSTVTDPAMDAHDPSLTRPLGVTGNASTAHAYAGLLDGKDGQAEADLVREVMTVNPATQISCRENRRFVARAPATIAGWGVDQFLDIGSGIPAAPNLHEAVQAVNPRARVVYVDKDPTVRVHNEALQLSSPQGRVVTVEGDLLRPEDILTDSKITEVLDLSRPVAVCTHAVFQFFRNDQRDPVEVVEALMDPLPSGSYLSITHATPDFHPPRMWGALEVYHRHGVRGATLRTYDEFEEFFTSTGLEVLDPGIVPVQRWRPDTPEKDLPEDEDMGFWAAVARRP